MSTLPALPGIKVRGQGCAVVPEGGMGTPAGHLVVSTVTVTRPAVRMALLITLPVEGLVTSTPRTTPEPPGVTTAVVPCLDMAICGSWPVLGVTCAERHWPV